MLQKDGLSPNAKIANKVGVSEETVRRRVKRMLKDDYLRVVAVPNTEKMGFSSQVLIGLQVIPEKMDLVAERLSNIPEVRWLSVTTGSFDIFAWVILKDSKDLGVFLRQTVFCVEGIQKVETFMNLDLKTRNLDMVM
ncbi:MAG: Lrp/AsnC family transcriptional regulator [SAR202 cluster bacterium]|nr:Lrp/AsnC family transcriptional regulator [SAR202 cluster bacterium]